MLGVWAVSQSVEDGGMVCFLVRGREAPTDSELSSETRRKQPTDYRPFHIFSKGCFSGTYKYVRISMQAKAPAGHEMQSSPATHGQLLQRT